MKKRTKKLLLINAAILRKATLVDQPRDTINTDLAVNIGGAMAAVQAAAPRMFERGCGTVLLTGGAFGLHPHPDFLSLSIGKAGIRALALGIFETFKENGVHVATLTVSGIVNTTRDATAVAERFWQLHSQPTASWTVEATWPEV